MKTMKRVLALLLAVLMVLTVAACGKKSDGDGKTDPADKTENGTSDVIVVGYTEYKPMNYEENGELRFCTYCGAPFYHVVDVYQEWTRSYRMAGDENWLDEERFAQRAAAVEEESRGEYRRWLAERMEENK